MSHDRAFLDNVVTQTVASEGDGLWREYVGGYTDWLRQRPQAASPRPRARRCRPPRSRWRRRSASSSYKEQRELESLPGEIEKLENRAARCIQKMCADDYHRIAPEEMRRDGERAVELESLIAARMERWISRNLYRRTFKESHETRKNWQTAGHSYLEGNRASRRQGSQRHSRRAAAGRSSRELCSALKKKCGTGGTVRWRHRDPGRPSRSHRR